MQHDEAEMLLGAFALGALDEQEADLLGAHIENCPYCAHELARYVEIVRFLDDR